MTMGIIVTVHGQLEEDGEIRIGHAGRREEIIY